MNNNLKGYLIHEVVKDKKYIVCKILNEYESLNEAESNLIDLLTSKKTENDLLKDYKDKVKF